MLVRAEEEAAAVTEFLITVIKEPSPQAATADADAPDVGNAHGVY